MVIRRTKPKAVIGFQEFYYAVVRGSMEENIRSLKAPAVITTSSLKTREAAHPKNGSL